MGRDPSGQDSKIIENPGYYQGFLGMYHMYQTRTRSGQD